MKFNQKTFAEKIQSKYIEYDTQIGEVICHIFDRDKNKSDFDNFYSNIKDSDFFDLEKTKEDALTKIGFEFATKALTSAIIKECKYNTHFIPWNKGIELTNTFFQQFNEIDCIYTNSHWEKFFDDNEHKDELDMTGWNKFSLGYWYDYGFLIISNDKIGVIWFGDES